MSLNPFWDFSLQHYSKPPVRQLCLELQEQVDANINQLLFALWLATENRVFEHKVIVSNTAYQNWHRQVMLPLRQVRYAAKRLQGEVAVYPMLKQSELAAERVEQDMLYRMLPQFVGVEEMQDLQRRAALNMCAYLQTLAVAQVRRREVAHRFVAEVFPVCEGSTGH